jgi:TRAP-type C4-dicarboxylate transport system permease small subunit
MTALLHESRGVAGSIEPANGMAGRIARVLDTAVKWATELPAVLLLIAEVALLLANVVYRYALHDPLTWADELASLLFIWLAMLGAVIALRRGEHMRLTTFIARMSPGACSARRWNMCRKNG